MARLNPGPALQEDDAIATSIPDSNTIQDIYIFKGLTPNSRPAGQIDLNSLCVLSVCVVLLQSIFFNIYKFFV